MTFETNVELDVFFDDFGEPVIIGHETASQRTICGIFDYPHSAVLGDGVDVSTNQPQLTVKYCDIKNVEQDSIWFLPNRDKSYSIDDFIPDGTGFSTVMLRVEDATG